MAAGRQRRPPVFAGGERPADARDGRVRVQPLAAVEVGTFHCVRRSAEGGGADRLAHPAAGGDRSGDHGLTVAARDDELGGCAAGIQAREIRTEGLEREEDRDDAALERARRQDRLPTHARVDDRSLEQRTRARLAQPRRALVAHQRGLPLGRARRARDPAVGAQDVDVTGRQAAGVELECAACGLDERLADLGRGGKPLRRRLQHCNRATQLLRARPRGEAGIALSAATPVAAALHEHVRRGAGRHDHERHDEQREMRPQPPAPGTRRGRVARRDRWCGLHVGAFPSVDHERRARPLSRRIGSSVARSRGEKASVPRYSLFVVPTRMFDQWRDVALAAPPSESSNASRTAASNWVPRPSRMISRARSRANAGR